MAEHSDSIRASIMQRRTGISILALGSNLPGATGAPPDMLAFGVQALSNLMLQVGAVSRVFKSRAMGGPSQPDYFNICVSIRTGLAPGQLLRAVKVAERTGGRHRKSSRWSARSLDIDLIDVPGWRLGWPHLNRSIGQLVLPHPLAHKRLFVLRPLLDVMPSWTHPTLHLGGRALAGAAALLGEPQPVAVGHIISDGGRWRFQPERPR